MDLLNILDHPGTFLVSVTVLGLGISFLDALYSKNIENINIDSIVKSRKRTQAN